MDFRTMSTAALASLLRNSHLEMVDGLTAEIRAAGAQKYTAVRAYLRSLPR